MSEIVGVQIQIGGETKVVQTVGELKKLLKEAQFEALKMSSQFGETSQEALAAAKNVAILKDQIKDTAERVDLFDPGKKFQVFSNAISAAAGGISALQGAMGLFGAESEDVQKSLLKVQSALALSQGLSVLADSAKDFQRLAGIVRTQVVTAFSTLRGAIIATGIGALAVGLGLLIANFDKVKKAVLDLIPGLGKVADFVGSMVNKFTDFIGVTSDATRELEKLKDATDAITSSLDNQIKILEAQGNREGEVYELRKQRIEAERKLLIEQQKVKGELSKEEVDRLVGLNTDLSVLDAQETQRRKKVSEERNKEAQDAAFERAQIQQQELKDQFAKDEEAYKKRKELREKEQQDIQTFGLIKAENDKLEKEAEEERQKIFEERLQSLNEGTLGKFLEAKSKETGATITTNEAKRKADELYLQQKKQLADAEIGVTADALNAISDLIGQQTIAGKALSVAAAIINTYQGATKALAQGGFLGIAGAATVIATGLASVKRIISTKVPVAGGGGASSQPVDATAPLQPQTTLAANQVVLDQRSINALGNQAIRAYVVENDITRSQNRIRRIERSTRFG